MKTLKVAGILTALLFSIEVWGQGAAAELHFESAEKAYNAGNYKEVLTKLDDTERLAGPSSRTLYLRIVTQDKIFKSKPQSINNLDFDLLSSLREHIAIYLEEMADFGLDDRYRQIYSIQESLDKHPKTYAEWQAMLEKERQQQKEREDQAYRAALASEKVTDYERFLSLYGSSDRAEEIHQRLAGAKERDAYQAFVTNKSSVNAEYYLRNFPNGSHKNEVLTTYEEVLFAEGMKHFNKKEFALARDRFSTYKTNFPNGSNISAVESNLQVSESKTAQQAKMSKWGDIGYFMLTYGTNHAMGFEGGSLNVGRDVGFYYAVNANPDFFKVSFSPEDEVYSLDGIDKSEYGVGVGTASFGVNFTVAFPLTVYGGLGVRYISYYAKDDPSLKFKVEDRKAWGACPEIGVKYRAGRSLVLKAGVQLMGEATAFQFGIGF